METKEFNFKGTTMNGFFMLFVAIVLPILAVWGIYEAIVMYDIPGHGILPTILLILGALMLIVELFILNGFMMLEPNTARVTTWFGKYSGTFTRTGFYWINPFYGTKKVSLRATVSRRPDSSVKANCSCTRPLPKERRLATWTPSPSR